MFILYIMIMFVTIKTGGVLADAASFTALHVFPMSLRDLSIAAGTHFSWFACIQQE